jgi:hypothetical protein
MHNLALIHAFPIVLSQHSFYPPSYSHLIPFLPFCFTVTSVFTANTAVDYFPYRPQPPTHFLSEILWPTLGPVDLFHDVCLFAYTIFTYWLSSISLLNLLLDCMLLHCHICIQEGCFGCYKSTTDGAKTMLFFLCVFLIVTSFLLRNLQNLNFDIIRKSRMINRIFVPEVTILNEPIIHSVT